MTGSRDNRQSQVPGLDLVHLHRGGAAQGSILVEAPEALQPGLFRAFQGSPGLYISESCGLHHHAKLEPHLPHGHLLPVRLRYLCLNSFPRPLVRQLQASQPDSQPSRIENASFLADRTRQRQQKRPRPRPRQAPPARLVLPHNLSTIQPGSGSAQSGSTSSTSSAGIRQSVNAVGQPPLPCDHKQNHKVEARAPACPAACHRLHNWPGPSLTHPRTPAHARDGTEVVRCCTVILRAPRPTQGPREP